MGVARVEAAAETPAPDPRSLAVALVLGLAAVLFLPSLAPHVPHIGNAAEARWAITGTGLLLVLGVFVYVEGRRRRFSTAWMAWTWGYGAGLVVVKFVLSPSAYSRSNKSLTAFVVTGLVVLLLYLAALVMVAAVVGRPGKTLSLVSKLMLGLALAAAAMVARIAAAAVLGTTSTYVHDLSRGTGLILPALVILASIAVMQSYELAGSALRHAFWLSIFIVVMLHSLWVVYMYRLY